MTQERLGRPVTVGELRITPVERMSVRRETIGGRVWIAVAKRPVAILIRSPRSEWRIELEPGSRSSL